MPPPTREMLASVFTYNPDTGLFLRRGRVSGCLDGYGYIRLNVKKRSFRAHQLAWLWVHGRWPIGRLDHHNGIRSDNRIENLREGSVPQQNQNSCVRRDAESGRKGVEISTRPGRRKRWKARIMAFGKRYNLGAFPTIEAAGEAYDKKARELHGEFMPSAARRGALKSLMQSPIIQATLAASAIEKHASGNPPHQPD